jgi:3-isopropylmalate dehydrogenase
MLLDWRGHRDGERALADAAAGITAAVDAALDAPATRTRDIGGTLGTSDFADVVRTALRNTASVR